MQRTALWIAWLLVAAAIGLLSLNWSVVMAPVPFDLVFRQAELPLGLVMFLLAAAPACLLFVAYLQRRIGTLLETRRLMRELQAVQQRADQAEASRIGALRTLIEAEFASLQGRLDRLVGASEARDPDTRRVTSLPG